MMVFVRWNDGERERTEITRLIGDCPLFVKGTNIEVVDVDFGDLVMFEDEEGLWCLEPDQIIEMRLAGLPEYSSN